MIGVYMVRRQIRRWLSVQAGEIPLTHEMVTLIDVEPRL